MVVDTHMVRCEFSWKGSSSPQPLELHQLYAKFKEIGDLMNAEWMTHVVSSEIENVVSLCTGSNQKAVAVKWSFLLKLETPIMRSTEEMRELVTEALKACGLVPLEVTFL